jgi:hypothetical protein
MKKSTKKLLYDLENRLKQLEGRMYCVESIGAIETEFESIEKRLSALENFNSTEFDGLDTSVSVDVDKYVEDDTNCDYERIVTLSGKLQSLDIRSVCTYLICHADIEIVESLETFLGLLNTKGFNSDSR